MQTLSRVKFQIVSNESFEKIKDFVAKNIDLIDDPYDYHFEETEEDLFNWIHDDKMESSISIKQAPMPSEMNNVLHLPEGWFFWYV